MPLHISLLLLGSFAARAYGQTFTVSECSTVSGQQVCLGPGGSSVTFTAAQTAAPSSAPATSAPVSTTPAPPPTSAASISVTAISECHYHGDEPYCFVGSSEYQIMTSYTRTEELPAQFTDCHGHGSEELFCVGPSGEDVEVRPEGATTSTSDSHDHSGEAGAEENREGWDCHFHGGVEHCIPPGGSESGASTERSCERQERDYDVGIRIGMLFVVLATSAIAVFTPILMSSILKIKVVSFILLQLKQFGTGVLVATAFVHLYTHAELMLTNSCLSWPARYEGTTAALVMAGIFLSFLVEYVGSRIIIRTFKGDQPIGETRSSDGDESGKSAAEASITNLGHHFHAGTFYSHPQQQKLAVGVLEAGIIFHSLLIGLTLVVAGDSVFGSLVVVIIFHQMFEGIALGARIAELPSQTTNGSAPVTKAEKFAFAGAFALVTPIGMAVGIGVLQRFNGNDASTLIVIGTLDAISAGILAWVSLVEMWAGDWLHGPLARAPLLTAGVSGVSLMLGMGLMSFLGKWA